MLHFALERLLFLAYSVKYLFIKKLKKLNKLRKNKYTNYSVAKKIKKFMKQNDSNIQIK